MGANSKIEWTHHTFNHVRGCAKVSAGCDHCYAEQMSKRNPAALGVWGREGQRIIAAESYWKLPLRWNAAAAAARERHRVFCASLADVFEGPETMPASEWSKVEQARVRLLHELIPQTPHLDWLLLTKRPENIARLVHQDWMRHWPDNVWIGTSVENQAAADERIPHLLKVPARVRFLSMEPLLGPVDLERYIGSMYCSNCGADEWYFTDTEWHGALEDDERRPLSWLIVGGESGGKARPMHSQWARSLRDQCQEAGVPFFFKQWGEYLHRSQVPGSEHHAEWVGVEYLRVGKKSAGRLLDGRDWNEVPG